MNNQTITAMQAAVEANVPVMLWGGPGIGKTSIIKELFEAAGWTVIFVSCNTADPTDFGGFPFVKPDTGELTMSPPPWAVRASNAERVLCVFDELNTAPASVAAAALRLIQSKWAGDYFLGDHVRMIAASNPPAMNPAAAELSAPMANRFLHLNVEANSALNVEGETFGWDVAMRRLTGLPIVSDADELTTRRVAHGAKISTFFHQARPDLFYKLPATEATQGQAWPSPRSWTNLMDVLTYLPDDADEARHLATIGCVGEGVGIEYLCWERTADLPDADAVLSDAAIYDWSDGSLDRTFAVLQMVTARAIQLATKSAWIGAWKALAAAADANRADLAMPAASNLVGAAAFTGHEVPNCGASLLDVVGQLGNVA